MNLSRGSESHVEKAILIGPGAFARSFGKDRCRFYTMAFASIREIQAILDLVELDASFTKEADSIAASIYKLIKSCK